MRNQIKSSFFWIFNVKYLTKCFVKIHNIFKNNHIYFLVIRKWQIFLQYVINHFIIIVTVYWRQYNILCRNWNYTMGTIYYDKINFLITYGTLHSTKLPIWIVLLFLFLIYYLDTFQEKFYMKNNRFQRRNLLIDTIKFIVIYSSISILILLIKRNQYLLAIWWNIKWS